MLTGSLPRLTLSLLTKDYGRWHWATWPATRPLSSLSTYNLALFILSFVSLGKQHSNGSLRRKTCTHGSGLPVPAPPGHSEAFCIYTREGTPWEAQTFVSFAANDAHYAAHFPSITSLEHLELPRQQKSLLRWTEQAHRTSQPRPHPQSASHAGSSSSSPSPAQVIVTLLRSEPSISADSTED